MSAFETLGLTEEATPAEVKRRWQELASTAHPDRGGDSERFHELRQAYEAALHEAGQPKRCDACHGSGKKTVQRGFSQIRLPCDRCDGSGFIEVVQ